MLFRSQNYQPVCHKPSPNYSVRNLEQNPLSKSTASVAPTLEALQNQVWLFKEKAHQSFMQVLQMQSVHEQETMDLRAMLDEQEKKIKQKDDRIQQFQKVIQEYQVKMRQLQYENQVLEKNTKIHLCDIEQDEFSIDNIDAILGRQQSALDESSMVFFKQWVQGRGKQVREILGIIVEQSEYLKNNIRTDQKTQLTSRLSIILEQINLIVRQHQQTQVQIVNTQKMFEEIEGKNKINRITQQNLQKQYSFMSEQLKRISSEKLRLEKRLSENQKFIKNLQQKIKKMELKSSKDVQETRSSHNSRNNSIEDELDKKTTIRNIKETTSVRQPGQLIYSAALKGNNSPRWLAVKATRS